MWRRACRREARKAGLVVGEREEARERVGRCVNVVVVVVSGGDVVFDGFGVVLGGVMAAFVVVMGAFSRPVSSSLV